MADEPVAVGARAETEAPPPVPERRVLGLVLAVIALAALGYAGLSHDWLANAGYSQELGIGLRDNYACLDRGTASRCESLTNAELVDRYDARVDAPRHFLDGSDAEPVDDSPWGNALPKPGLLDHASSVFVPMGWATLGLIALGALGLVIAMAIAIVRGRPRLPLSPCTIAVVALGIDLLCGLVFVATKPGPTGMVGVGTAFWVFGGGVLFGVAAALVLTRAIRPLDPDLMEDAMDPEEY